jgi:Zn-dependent protease
MLGGGSSLQLVRIAGIRVGINSSWFLIVILWVYWLQGSFATALGSDGQGFTAAVIAVVLFFGSILLHELGHAFAARREGIGVEGVDLLFFGGVTYMDRESRTPGEEFRVAAAGPAVTLLLAIVFAVLSGVLGSSNVVSDAIHFRVGGSDMLQMVVAFSAGANAVLFLFNLLPAFPLDGGRITRSIAWKVTGDRHKATRLSGFLGQVLAVLLGAFGLYLILTRNDFGSGIWSLLLAWMIGSAARAVVAQSTFVTRIEGVTAADIMDAEPVTIPASLPVERAYEEFFLRYQGWPWFAVVEDDGRFVGLAHREAVEHAAQASTAALPVRSLAADAGQTVTTSASLESLIGSEALRRVGALMAVDAEGRLRGVITLEQVSRALQAKLA